MDLIRLLIKPLHARESFHPRRVSAFELIKPLYSSFPDQQFVLLRALKIHLYISVISSLSHFSFIGTIQMYFPLILDLSLSICQLQECWTIARLSVMFQGKERKEKSQNVYIRSQNTAHLHNNILICSSKSFLSDNQMPI